MDVRDIVAQSLKKVQALQSYQCVMELHSWQKGEKSAVQRYLYRAPGDVRIEQIGLFRTGSLLVIRSNGKVTAKGGGLLSAIKIDLSGNSKLLVAITGDSAMESDWSSIYRKMQSYTSSLLRSSCNPARNGYEATMQVANLPYDSVRLIIRNDGPLLLIDRFKGKKLLSRIEWKNIVLNPSTSDEDFNL